MVSNWRQSGIDKGLTAAFSSSTTASFLSCKTSTRLTRACFSRTCCKRPSCVARGRLRTRTDRLCVSACRPRPVSLIKFLPRTRISFIQGTGTSNDHTGYGRVRGYLQALRLCASFWVRNYSLPLPLEHLAIIGFHKPVNDGKFEALHLHQTQRKRSPLTVHSAPKPFWRLWLDHTTHQ